MTENEEWMELKLIRSLDWDLHDVIAEDLINKGGKYNFVVYQMEFNDYHDLISSPSFITWDRNMPNDPTLYIQVYPR